MNRLDFLGEKAKQENQTRNDGPATNSGADRAGKAKGGTQEQSRNGQPEDQTIERNTDDPNGSAPG